MNANTNTNTGHNTNINIDTNTIIDTNIVNPTCESSNQNLVNPAVIVEKKKRGRKKTIKPDVILPNQSNQSEDNTMTTITEKKIRKRRSKKNMAIAKALASALANSTDNTNSIETTDLKVEVVPGVKVRKRRVCKSKNNKNPDTIDGINTDKNVIIDSNNPETHPVEEKVAKKRGRKPKGGKIITQKLLQ